jgi:hypothetical protein
MMPFKLLRACWQSLKSFSRLQPRCEWGDDFHGRLYCIPGGLMAGAAQQTALLVHGGAHAGLTNRVLALMRIGCWWVSRYLRASAQNALQNIYRSLKESDGSRRRAHSSIAALPRH